MNNNQPAQMPNIKYTSSAAIDATEIPDNAVQICGYIDYIDSNCLYASPNQKKFYKLIINNGDGKKVQVTAWEEAIMKVKHVNTNLQQVLIYNLTSHVPNQTYNKGNIPFELLVRKNTTVEVLGVHTFTSEEKNAAIKLDSILDIKNNINNRVCIEPCWVKSSLGIYTTKRSKFYVGSITDGRYKLDVHCRNLDKDLTNLVNKGYPVKITGNIEKYLESPYALVIKGEEDYQELPYIRLDPEDIQNFDSTQEHHPIMSLKKVLQGFRPIES